MVNPALAETEALTRETTASKVRGWGETEMQFQAFQPK